jgi:hypothetical protein
MLTNADPACPPSTTSPYNRIRTPRPPPHLTRIYHAQCYLNPPHQRDYSASQTQPRSQCSYRQSGRMRPANLPYAKSPMDRDPGNRPRGTLPPSASTSGLVAGLGGRGGKINPNVRPGRQAQGTPPGLQKDRAEGQRIKTVAHSRLNEKLAGDGMREWLRSRMIGEGIMNMSVSNLVISTTLADTVRAYTRINGSRSKAYFHLATLTLRQALGPFCGNSLIP